MINVVESSETPATTLCKSCGLCCTGHLFVWTKLRSAELDVIQGLGLNVMREPGQRGFNQPCPLWDGICTIHESPQYPRFCRTYRCKLLKKMLDESTPLHTALTVIQQTKDMIRELDAMLPASPKTNFRERLVAQIENENSGMEFQQKAKELLEVYEAQFGINDLLDDPSDKS